MYLPRDVVYNLKIKDGDLLDFIKNGDYYILATSDFLLEKITAQKGQKVEQKRTISEEELVVLKKLDSLRYKNRTEEVVAQMLEKGEKAVLNSLISKRYVVPLKSREDTIYNINDDIYKRFLVKDWAAFEKFSKRGAATPKEEREMAIPEVKAEKIDQKAATQINEDITEELRRNGYLVIPGVSEAESASLRLEGEIRSGLVIGTRAFNKKYYIVYRSFMNKHSPAIISALRKKDTSTDELAKMTGLDLDGVRSIMFILSERGEVMEKRHDFFSLID